MKIWQKLLFKKALTSSLFALSVSCALFALIDLSSHPWIFQAKNPLTILLFTAGQLSKMFSMLAGFSVLVGTLSTILSLQQSNELVALNAAGLSKLKLFAPLLASSLLFSTLSLANYQWLYPSALAQTGFIKKNVTQSVTTEAPLRTVRLSDELTLIFRHRKGTTLHDLYLIMPKKLIHAQSLDLNAEAPLGHFVDIFKRTNQGLVHKKSYESKPFYALFGLKKQILAPPLERRSLTKLSDNDLIDQKEIHLSRITLHSRLLLALLSPLAAFFAAAWLAFRSRGRSQTRAYSFALTLFVLYLLVLNGTIFFLLATLSAESYQIWLLALPFAPFFWLARKLPV